MNDYLIKKKKFSSIDINDPFFDSLKQDYKEFESWFISKSEKNKFALIFEENNKIDGFLYLKQEDEELLDIEPNLPKSKRLKVGTFKVNPHGTRLGERFMKKIFDYSIGYDFREIYVTVFPKHEALINLFLRYGFVLVGTKSTHNGIENVYLRIMNNIRGDVKMDYPYVKKSSNTYLLAIYPKFHSVLFPDSLLNSETFDVLSDVSHTNSIHKVYVCFMDVSVLSRGDNIIIYRTSDNKGPAEYRSVATSICVVEEVKSKNDFKNAQDFVKYCSKYSVFDEKDLTSWFRRSQVFTIRMTYNVALEKRINRGKLISDVGFERNQYWGFFGVSSFQFNRLIKMGMTNESAFIN